MSARLWSALVILKDHELDPGADVNGNFDLSNKYIAIEYEDTFPRSAIITLNAKGGRFITVTPKIQKWDRVYLEITDQNGKKVTPQVFQIESMEKMRPVGKGLQLKLYCSHQSSNLVTQTISNPNRRVSGRVAMQEVCNQMNENRGSRDPFINNVDLSFESVSKRGIFLDQFTSNEYIFESVKAQVAIDEIIDREGLPVEGGGSFEFFYFNFDSAYVHPDNSLLNQVYVQCFPQGFVDQGGPGPYTNIPNVTLDKFLLEPNVHSNTLALESHLETEKGTNLIAIGDFQSGSYPVDYAKFRGEKTAFDSARNWETGNTYRAGTTVTFLGSFFECILLNVSESANDPVNGLGVYWTGRVFDKNAYFEWAVGGPYTKNEVVIHNTIGYKALQDHQSNSTNEPPNPDFWRRVSYAPTVDYSPLTKGVAQEWINAMGGSKHSTTDNKKCAVLDPSLIIRDALHPRTWVDGVTVDSRALPTYLFRDDQQPNVQDRPFEGFRVLVMNPIDGTTSVPDLSNNKFAENYDVGAETGYDINGRPFANNIAEWQIIDGLGQYVVIDLNSKFGDTTIYPGAPTDNDLLDDQEVYDFNEGDSWIRNPLIPPLNLSRFTVWTKGAYYAISDSGFVVFQADTQFSCVHNPQFDATAQRVDIVNGIIVRPDVDLDADSAVIIKFDPLAGLTLAPTILAIPVLTRFMGLNFAFPWPRTSQSLPYGAPVIGEKIDLPFFDLFNFDKTADDNRQWFGPEVEEYYPFQGVGFEEFIRDNIPLDPVQPKFRGDYSMGVWMCDNRDNIWIMDYNHSHNDVTEQKVANLSAKRVFRARFGFAGFIAPVEPEVVDIVDPRRIVRGGMYTKQSFNEQGQYDIRNKFSTSGTLEYGVDAFRFVKPLICTNNDEPNALPVRNKEPQKLQFEKITDYINLKNFVQSIDAIYNFRTDKYRLLTPGRGDIVYGDPVYYTDPEALEETTDAIPNTIKGVASNVMYSLSKTPDGPGGFIRHVELTTRLWPDEEVPP